MAYKKAFSMVCNLLDTIERKGLSQHIRDNHMPLTEGRGLDMVSNKSAAIAFLMENGVNVWSLRELLQAAPRTRKQATLELDRVVPKQLLREFSNRVHLVSRINCENSVQGSSQFTIHESEIIELLDEYLLSDESLELIDQWLKTGAQRDLHLTFCLSGEVVGVGYSGFSVEPSEAPKAKYDMHVILGLKTEYIILKTAYPC